MSSRGPAIALVTIALLLVLAGCKQQPLPVLGEVPHFDLIDQSGQPFDRAQLAGRVWVADFFFTTCTGPCPRMSSQMRQVQTATADLSDVRLISFTVDPTRDTAPVLADYAKRYKAQPGRWSFLTGDPAKLNDLALHSFHLNSVDGSMVHSTRFALVDRAGRIRGYYTSSDDDFLPHLINDIKRLQQNPNL